MKIYSYRGKKNLSGDKIREARLKQRLSQSDLAAKVQIAGVTLERDSIEIWINNYPRRLFNYGTAEERFNEEMAKLEGC